MIELLVVIAIIAILAAILFPVFAQAKEAAKKTACLSNLKQITLANLMYANDYDDTFCLQSTGFQSNASGTFFWLDYWWGQADYAAPAYLANTDLTKGLLGPYTKSGAIEGCPSATYNFTYVGNAAPVQLGYGYNEEVFAMPQASAMDVPSDTIMFADTANDSLEGGGTVLVTASGADFEPGYDLIYVDSMGDKNALGIQARHGGNVANISWVDGHAKANQLSYNTPFDDSSHDGAAWAQSYHVGALIYGAQEENPSNSVGAYPLSPQQCHDYYYYFATKSTGDTLCPGGSPGSQ